MPNMMKTKKETSTLCCSCALGDRHLEDTLSVAGSEPDNYLRDACRGCIRRIRRQAILNTVLSLIREETGRQIPRIAL
jgi:hypothetical protein